MNLSKQNKNVSPLRRRMMEDMRMRKLAPKTQQQYVRHVRQLAAYLHRAPDTATVEDLRNYQLYLVEHGTSPISLNAAITGLKFFFNVTVSRPEVMAKIRSSVLKGLSKLPPAERTILLDTFQAWLEAGGSANDTAEKIYCHPNTMRHRLRRIEELTHRSLSRPKDIAELCLAFEVEQRLP